MIHLDDPDHSKPWDFFDGAYSNLRQQSGGGFILHLSVSHFFQVKMGFSSGSNNMIEIIACKNLLLFALVKSFSQIQMYSNSMLIIN